MARIMCARELTTVVTISTAVGIRMVLNTRRCVLLRREPTSTFHTQSCFPMGDGQIIFSD